MAFVIGRNINLDDLAPNKSTGMSLLFNANSVFNPVYSTKEQVKANLINFVLTGKGERMLNPNYGLGLKNLLFESSNDITEKQAGIRSLIEINFPQITIGDFSLGMDPAYENTLLLKMTYSVSNSTDTLTLAIQ